MAVACSVGNWYSTTSGVITGATATNASYAMWVRRDSGTQAYAGFWGMQGTNTLMIMTEGNGDALGSYNDYSNDIWNIDPAGVRSMTLGSWYYAAFVQNGTTLNYYSTPLGTSTLTTHVGSDTASTSTPAFNTMGWGRWPFADFPLTGSVAFYRDWSASLTKTELEAELASTTPVRTSNLHRDMRFASGALQTDSSSNGYTITTPNGTPTFTADPTLGTPGKMSPVGRRRGIPAAILNR